ncbi:MAG: hypothetical protein ABIG84_02910 [archaeon]
MDPLTAYYHSLINHKGMNKNIQSLEIPDDEKTFLKISLDNTCTYEKSTAGKCYYNLGGGRSQNEEILSLCGDYIFLVRVLDNVIDGHVNEIELKSPLAKKMLDYITAFMNNVECTPKGGHIDNE